MKFKEKNQLKKNHENFSKRPNFIKLSLSYRNFDSRNFYRNFNNVIDILKKWQKQNEQEAGIGLRGCIQSSGTQ